MSNELAIKENNNLSLWEDPLNLKEIRELFAPNLTELEFRGFVNMGKASDLNPFLREIWAVKYDKSKPAQYFIGRDGYRKSAVGHPQYDYHRVEAVYSDDFYENDNGVVTHKYSFGKRGTLLGAYCIVKRKGSTQPMYTSVLLSEYDKRQSNWNTMKETMIKKVAEAQGLKAAFPERFAGTYSEYEEGVIIENRSENNLSQQEKMNSLLAKKGINNAKNDSNEQDNHHRSDPIVISPNGELCNTNSISSSQDSEPDTRVEVAPDGESKNSVTDKENEDSVCSEKQLEYIELLIFEKSFDEVRRIKALKHFGVHSFAELSEEQANEMIKILNKLDIE